MEDKQQMLVLEANSENLPLVDTKKEEKNDQTPPRVDNPYYETTNERISVFNSNRSR